MDKQPVDLDSFEGHTAFPVLAGYENPGGLHEVKNGDGSMHYVAEFRSQADAEIFVAAPSMAQEIRQLRAENEALREVRKHAQSLMNGIETGMVTLDTPADETLANTLHGLSKALANHSGGA